MMKGKKILLGISGSIAAYKAILLTRLLVSAGAEVKIVLTPAAATFVSPLTLSTLSRNKVLISLAEEDSWANHVMLGRWADVMIIAPLTCNTLAKMANGLCDNLLLAAYLSATCPVVVAPAMDEDMWLHASTRLNLEKLASFGNKVISVRAGELASGLIGEGRMAEPQDIVNFVQEHVFRTEELKGRKVLITAGPTCEPLDPVRFISNHSSGKMGIAIAERFFMRGADVELVCGPVAISPAYQGIRIHPVTTASDMYEKAVALFPDVQIAVMAAAVADYTPLHVADSKIKKREAEFQVALTKTRDILHTLGHQKKTGQCVVGFALETNNELENAREKLQRKNADAIVLNSMRDAGAGFGGDTNTITILTQKGEFAYSSKSKIMVADDIVDFIKTMIDAHS